MTPSRVTPSAVTPSVTPATAPAPTPTVEDIGFRARALAQAHALSEPAAAYRRWRVGRDAAEHPVAEVPVWASTAFLVGYCLRRVEESFAGVTTIMADDEDEGADRESAFLNWERDAAVVARSVLARSGPALLDARMMAAALDNVIGREIDKRNEHVREQLSSDDWADFEAFIAWWVLHGYAIRSTETGPDTRDTRA